MKTWDIFCKVIDNYGDAGIAWRVARQLAHEYAADVRLWIDDLSTLQRIRPEIAPHLEIQHSAGVEVRHWCEPFPPVAPADVVIEAFGCALPEGYLAAMAGQAAPPVWINLEYLSAEAWVKTHHALPSPHPRLPLTKYFYFPGYENPAGGLLRERDLALRRRQFLEHDAAAFRQRLGLPLALPGELQISLFAYENPALPNLLDAWAHGEATVQCFVPEGRITPQLAAWLGEPFAAGTRASRGKLHLHSLPFLNQDDYDRLLWICDINFVRGEDSWLRAQWAHKPLVWQCYPQDHDVHFDKLAAFTALYTEGLPLSDRQAVSQLWDAWNGRGDVAAGWQAFISRRDVVARHADTWAQRLARVDDLASKLVAFVEDAEAG